MYHENLYRDIDYAESLLFILHLTLSFKNHQTWHIEICIL